MPSFLPDALEAAKGIPRFLLASPRGMGFSPARMSSLPTADLLALDTDGLKSRLSKLRRYL
jgi:hypothetical protein